MLYSLPEVRQNQCGHDWDLYLLASTTATLLSLSSGSALSALVPLKPDLRPWARKNIFY